MFLSYNRISILLYNLFLLIVLNYNFNNLYLNNKINLIFILLTLFIWPIVNLLTNNKLEKLFLLLLFISLTLLFYFNNLLYFYLFFELSLIIILIYIILFGYRFKKYEAFYKLWIYSITGSIFMFISIILIFYILGNNNNYIIELYINNNNYKYLIYILLTIGLLIKLPIYYLHNWLTLAHVEANTIGSIILASIILKISIFGLLKYNIIAFYSIIEYLSNIYILIGLLSIVLISHIILNQIDLKLIIAYSSIIHTNYMLLGLYSYNNIGIFSAIYSSIAHAFISTGLFLSVGILYNKYHNRIILYYKNLITFNPLYIIALNILLLSNISLPFTSNFIGELSLFISFFNNNIILIIIPLLYLIIATAYNLIILNKLSYNKLNSYLLKYKDLTFKEFIILYYLLFIIIFTGIYSII